MKIQNITLIILNLRLFESIKYLGIICSMNGKFSAAISDLMKICQTVFFFNFVGALKKPHQT